MARGNRNGNKKGEDVKKDVKKDVVEDVKDVIDVEDADVVDVENVDNGDVTDVEDTESVEDVKTEDVDGTETEKITMITKSLKGGDLPDGFVIKKPTITLVNDVEGESFTLTDKVKVLFIEGARVRAQRVLRGKGKTFLEGKTKFSLNLSELFEKSTGASVDAVVSGVVSGDIELSPEQEQELYRRITEKYGTSPVKE
jgi:hypothetical protein